MRCDEPPADTAWIVDAFAPSAIDVELDMIEASLEAVAVEVDVEVGDAEVVEELATPVVEAEVGDEQVVAGAAADAQEVEAEAAPPDLDAMLAKLRPLDVVIVIGDPEPRTIPPPPDDGEDVVHCEVTPAVSDDEPTLVPWSADADDAPTGARAKSEPGLVLDEPVDPSTVRANEITAIRRVSESARHEAARINAHVVRRTRPPTPMTPPIDAARLPAPPPRPRLRIGRGTARVISESDRSAALRIATLRARRDAPNATDELLFDRDLARARAFAEHSREAKDVFPRDVVRLEVGRSAKDADRGDVCGEIRRVVEQIAVARRVAEPVPFPSAWAQLDERIAAMLPPDDGTVERVAEHAALDGRIVTRELVLVIADVDPLPAIERLGAEIARAGLQLEIDDHGIGAASPELCVRARGEQLFELSFQLVTEHDDVDLRDDMMRCDDLRPLLPLAELGRFVTRVGSGRQLGRSPHAAMSIALDDETRPCLHAWLTARDYEAVGSTWKLCADGFEYVVAFERSEELGVDEATAFVRPVPSRPPAPAASPRPRRRPPPPPATTET